MEQEEEHEEDGNTLPRVEWEQEEGSEGALPCAEQEQGMEEDLPDDAGEGRPQVTRSRCRRSHGDGVAGYAFDSRGTIVVVGSDSQLPLQHLPGKTPHNTLHYATGDNLDVFVAMAAKLLHCQEVGSSAKEQGMEEDFPDDAGEDRPQVTRVGVGAAMATVWQVTPSTAGGRLLWWAVTPSSHCSTCPARHPITPCTMPRETTQMCSSP